MRTLIEIDEKHVKQLDVIAKRGNQSRSALIRKAVQEFLARQKTDDLDAAFGLWGDREVDGLEYQERIRGEW